MATDRLINHTQGNQIIEKLNNIAGNVSYPQLVAPIETTSTASMAHAVGTYFVYNGYLYRTTVAISQGGTITPNTNCVTTNVGSELTSVKSDLSNIINLPQFVSHNIPRLTPKDITSYISDGSFWNRLNGTNGYELFDDIFVGDYIEMSQAITAPNSFTDGSKWITIAGLDSLMNNNATINNVSIVVNYHHAVMVPGKGFGGYSHFGRGRMNSSNDTTGGYKATAMFNDILGPIASSGSRAEGATINEQLYAEFGTHLKTTPEMLSNAIDPTRYNRYGLATGASSGREWTACQSVQMSEIEVFGSIIWSSSAFDTGNANKQLPLFAFSKVAINGGTAYYWLKDVSSATNFADCGNHGGATSSPASTSGYIRPRFVLAN